MGISRCVMTMGAATGRHDDTLTPRTLFMGGRLFSHGLFIRCLVSGALEWKSTSMALFEP